MELRIQCTEPVDGLEELADWLAMEPALRGCISRPSQAPDPRTLGSLDDVLAIAVGSGGTLSVLAASLKAFLSLPRRSDIHITVTSKDGTRVEIDAKRVADAEALVRETFGRGL